MKIITDVLQLRNNASGRGRGSTKRAHVSSPSTPSDTDTHIARDVTFNVERFSTAARQGQDSVSRAVKCFSNPVVSRRIGRPIAFRCFRYVSSAVIFVGRVFTATLLVIVAVCSRGRHVYVVTWRSPRANHQSCCRGTLFTGSADWFGTISVVAR